MTFANMQIAKFFFRLKAKMTAAINTAAVTRNIWNIAVRPSGCPPDGRIIQQQARMSMIKTMRIAFFSFMLILYIIFP